MLSGVLNPAGSWFQEFRRALSNRTFEIVELLLQEALTRTLAPYWEEPTRLQRLTGFLGGQRLSIRYDLDDTVRYHYEGEVVVKIIQCWQHHPSPEDALRRAAGG